MGIYYCFSFRTLCFNCIVRIKSEQFFVIVNSLKFIYGFIQGMDGIAHKPINRLNCKS